MSEANAHNSAVVCALMLDEMAIRKHVQWDGNKFHGYVNITVESEDDDASVATDALVLMVVALNSNWKVPVGYFPVNGLSRHERANIRACLMKLHDRCKNCFINM